MSDITFGPFDKSVSDAFDRIPLIAQMISEFNGKVIFLTGATGFFGQWILALFSRLNEAGGSFEVVALSRSSQKFLAKNPFYASQKWLRWVDGDIALEVPAYEQCVDFIIHAATDTSAASQRDKLVLFNAMVAGTGHILTFAQKSGAKRVLFTGSGAQYGRLVNQQPVCESFTGAPYSFDSNSAYAEAKRVQELLAAAHYGKYSIEPIFTRCFAFSGPGLDVNGHFAIGNFVRDAVSSKKIMLSSSGLSVRSYLHGADLAVWLLYLLVYGKALEAYNVGSDQGILLKDLACTVSDTLGGVGFEVNAQAGGADSYYVPNVDKAKLLGLEVWTPLEASLKSMAKWLTEKNL